MKTLAAVCLFFRAGRWCCAFLLLAAPAFLCPSAAAQDADGDGLPDAWELLHFGSPTGAPPYGDADADGQCQLWEYIAATEPTNAASAFAISNIAQGAAGAPLVQWVTPSGRLSRLEWSLNVLTGFSPLVTNVFPMVPLNVYTDAAHAATRFGYYRAGISLPGLTDVAYSAHGAAGFYRADAVGTPAPAAYGLHDYVSGAGGPISNVFLSPRGFDGLCVLLPRGVTWLSACRTRGTWSGAAGSNVIHLGDSMWLQASIATQLFFSGDLRFLTLPTNFVSPPTIVAASSTAGVDQAMTFTAAGAQAGDGGSLEYLWTWWGGSTQALGSWGGAQMTNSWGATGVVSVTVQARVAARPADVSYWSDPFLLTVVSQALEAVATPVLAPAAGTYSGGVIVTMTCSTAEAAIRYTLNDAAPTTNSSLYAAPVSLLSSATVRARAYKDGMAPSAEASAFYTVTPPPSISLSTHTIQVVAAAGTLLDPVSYQVMNGGGDALVFSNVEEVTWLDVTPDGGFVGTPPDFMDIAVTFDALGLGAGSYTGLITVTSPVADNGPQFVWVYLTLTNSPPPVTPPAAPSGITASDGTYTDHVEVNWGLVTNAQGYAVLRGLVHQQPSLLASTTATNYDDYAVTSGIGYVYYILSTNSAGEGYNINNHDRGFAGDMPPPSLYVNPTNLFPHITVGTTAAPQTFLMLNSGGDVMTYTNTETVSWLSISDHAGEIAWETNHDVTVTYDTAGLATGSYTGVITVDAGSISNSPAQVIVSLLVTNPPPPPVLQVTTGSVSVVTLEGAATTTATYGVRNAGGQMLRYTNVENATWFRVSPLNGASTGETDLITITFSNSILAAGSYEDIITVEGGNGVIPADLHVYLTVTSAPPAPEPLRVLFDFGSSSFLSTGNWNNVTNAAAGLHVSNAISADGAVTPVALSITSPFISINPNGGTLLSTLYPTNATRDRFMSAGGPTGSVVRLDGLDTNLLYDFHFFASTPGAQPGTSLYTVVAGTQSWTEALVTTSNIDTCAVVSGIRPESDGHLSFGVSGVYTSAFLSVLDFRASTSSAPLLAVSTNSYFLSVTQGQNLASASFEIWNSGGQTLFYTNTSLAGWFTASPLTGTSDGEHDTIILDFSTSGLSTGYYESAVSITSGGGGGLRQIHLFLTVYALPDTTPPSVPSNLHMLDRTTSTVIVAWTASTDDVAVAGYEIWRDGAPVATNPSGRTGYTNAGLAANTTYSNAVRAFDAATNFSAFTSLVVTTLPPPAPEIELTPASFAHSVVEGLNPAADTLQVRNSGGGNLVYTTSVDVAWMSVSPPSGVSAGESDPLSIVYDAGPLPAGAYTGRLTVAAAGALNTPQVVTVGLTVTPGGAGYIYFISDRDGSNEIYRMSGDGSGQERVTHNALQETFIDVHPDANRIACQVGWDHQSASIYIMNIDGSGATDLTPTTSEDWHPTFSPSGDRISFSSERVDGYAEIFLMNLDGSAVTQVTSVGSTYWLYYSSWTPDGQALVLSYGFNADDQIARVNVDGTGLTLLTPDNDFGFSENSPFMSPDGTRIVYFSSERTGYNQPTEIKVIDPDGSNPTYLTTTDGTRVDRNPRYTPDGSQIVFQSERAGNLDIYRIEADGSGDTRLTTHAASDFCPVIVWRRVEQPVISPNGGGFATSVVVSINCATPAAQVHFTTNGADPTTSDPVYASPFELTNSTVVSARGFKAGMTNSPLARAEFFRNDSGVTYTLTASAGPHGAILPAGVTTTFPGQTLTATIQPDPHAYVVDVLVDGFSVGPVASYEFADIASSHSISASFALSNFTITASAGPLGSISPAGVSTVDYGGTLSFSFTPDPHALVSDVLVDGQSVGVPLGYQFVDVTNNHTLSVAFAMETRSLSVNSFYGMSEPMTGLHWLDYGTVTNVRMVMTNHYNGMQRRMNVYGWNGTGDISWWGEGADTGPFTLYQNSTITWLWRQQYELRAEAGLNGSVNFLSVYSAWVDEGSNATVTAYPMPGYRFSQWLGVWPPELAASNPLTLTLWNEATITAQFIPDFWTIQAASGLNGSITPAGFLSVPGGNNQSFYINPDAGFRIEDVTVDGASVGAVASYEFTNVRADHTISSSFARVAHTITASAGPGGSVNPAGDVPVNDGDNAYFSFTPDAHASVTDVLVDGLSVGMTSSYTFVNVTADHTLAVAFALDQHTLSVSNDHGICVPASGAYALDYGTVTGVVLLAGTVGDASTQFVAQGWIGSGSVPSGSSTDTGTFPLTNDTSVTWLWKTQYWLSVQASAHGSAYPTSQWVNAGAGTNLVAIADPGYHFTGWTGDVPPGGTTNNPLAVAADRARSLTAGFAVDQYVMVATAGLNGTVSPAGSVLANHGSDIPFVIQAVPGAHIASVLVDGAPYGAPHPDLTHLVVTFTNVTAPHTLAATFNLAPALTVAVAPTSGVAPLRVTFDFRASTDPDNALARAEIDPTGDGSFDTAVDGGGVLVVEYPEPGTYVARLRVIDLCGAGSTGAASIQVLGQAPDAVLGATPLSGEAPLAVVFIATNSAAAPGRSIVVYEWDLNGDGMVDRISSTGVLSWIYSTPGAYPAAVRVTDNLGLKASDSLTVTVSPPALPAPSVSLVLSTNQGFVPLPVQCMAMASSAVPIVEYRWDFMHDSQVDAVTTSNTYGFLGVMPGERMVSVEVVDANGLSARAGQTLSVAMPDCGVWLTSPRETVRVWGSAVNLSAEAYSVGQLDHIRFEYMRWGELAWVEIATVPTPTGPLFPDPMMNPPLVNPSVSTPWNVTALAEGRYDLRVVAEGSYRTNASIPVTVWVSSTAIPDLQDLLGGYNGGFYQQTETYNYLTTAQLILPGGGLIGIPPGAAPQNTTVEVLLTSVNTNPASGAAFGQAPINENLHLNFGGNPMLGQPVTLIVPYNDMDNDGLVDGTSVPETTLTLFWFDPYTGTWQRPLSSMVNPEANYVEATTYHLTEFGLFGSLNLLNPASGGLLLSFTSEHADSTKAVNLTDGNPASYWRSQSPPAVSQVFVYAFTNHQGALLDRAVFNNFGQAGEGHDYYSGAFELLVSMDGVDYVSLTNATLLPNETPQLHELGGVTGRWIKLIISGGFSAEAWELAEFALQGSLTNDADADAMPDDWEMIHFGGFARGGSGDFDADDLDDAAEFAHDTNPTNADSDTDGMWDGWEIARTLNPLAADGDADPDGDRVLNRDEFTANTDPKSGLSVFKILSPSLAAGADARIIQWSSAPDRRYSVWRSTNLGQGFSLILDATNLSPAQNSYTDSVQSGSLYLYRINVRK